MTGQVEGDHVIVVLQSFDLPIPIGEVVANSMDKDDGFWLFRACSYPVQWRSRRCLQVHVAHTGFDGAEDRSDGKVTTVCGNGLQQRTATADRIDG